MGEFETKYLHEVTSMISGFAFKSKHMGVGESRVVKIKDVVEPHVLIDECDVLDETQYPAEKIAKYKLTEGDVLISMTGYLGRVAMMPSIRGTYFLNQRVAKLVPNEARDLAFIKFHLQNDAFKDHCEAFTDSATAQPNISVRSMSQFEIEWPSFENRQAIAEVLSSLDDKIDLLKRQNKTLESMAEALFRQWFIEEAQDDWGNSSLEHLIETTVGGEWGKESPQGDFVHKCLCMRGTDIADFANGDSQRTPERYLKESKVNKTRVTHGDLIIEISGGTDDQSTGRTFLYSNSARPLFPSTLVFSNFCRLIRPRIPELGTFLHFFIKYLLEKKFLFNLENGTSGIKNLDYKVLLFFEKFRLPPEGRMIEFHGQYVPLSDKIIANRIEIINLQKIRDTLLPKLMSGEVRVHMD